MQDTARILHQCNRIENLVKGWTKGRKKKRDGTDEFENALTVLVSLTACNPLLLPS